MAGIPVNVREVARQCGTLAMNAMTLGAMSRAAERERLEQRLELAFPDDWRKLLEIMDRLDRASGTTVSPYIMQMWGYGSCQIEETVSLYERCPAAFRGYDLHEVIGQPSRDILPKLADNLP